MLNEKFWLAAAFFCFFALIIKLVGHRITKALDGKSKQIAEEILAAKEMKNRAEKLLIAAEKYHQESLAFAQKLMRDSAEDAQKFSAESALTAQEEIAKKTAAACERLKIEEAAALREIKANVVSSALQNLSKNFSDGLDKKNHDYLISNATEDFGKILN